MEVIALQSGSSGNCIFVESGDTRVLFDAGISGRQAEQRLAEYGRDIRDVDALVVSHDHRDHAQGIGVFQRKYGIPVHISPDTLVQVKRKIGIGQLHEVHYFNSGSRIEINQLTIETVPTPHDAVDGVGFVVDDGARRLGILTDLGHLFDSLDAVVASLDAVVLESNHDLEMLNSSHYPASIKRRIGGQRGHISNVDAAELLSRSASSSMKWACLAHLSEECNTPQVALDTHHELLGHAFDLHYAPRDRAGELMVV